MKPDSAWTHVGSETSAPFAVKLDFYRKGKLNLAMNPIPRGQPGYQVSLSRASASGRNCAPTPADVGRRMKPSFPPGTWTETACSATCQQWEYLPDKEKM